MLLGELAQPLLGQLARGHPLRAQRTAKGRGEGAIEPVDHRLVLHAGGAGEIIELLRRRIDHVTAQRVEQRQLLVQAGGDAGGAQRIEEAKEHALELAVRCPVDDKFTGLAVWRRRRLNARGRRRPRPLERELRMKSMLFAIALMAGTAATAQMQSAPAAPAAAPDATMPAPAPNDTAAPASAADAPPAAPMAPAMSSPAPSGGMAATGDYPPLHVQDDGQVHADRHDAQVDGQASHDEEASQDDDEEADGGHHAACGSRQLGPAQLPGGGAVRIPGRGLR